MSPTASAATAMMPAISITSPASRSPTSPICRAGFGRIRIPEQRYAVFTHADHVASIRSTVNTIWNQWLPASGLKAADAPNFERYDEKFDPDDRQWRLRDLGARERVTRNAGIPSRLLGKDRTYFVITAGKTCMRGPCRTSRASHNKQPGGSPNVQTQRPRSRHRPRISRRAGRDAGWLGRAGGNPRPAPDPHLSRRPQGDRRQGAGRPERRGARPRRQDLHLQQWRLLLDSDRQDDHARPAAGQLSRRLDPARRPAIRPRSRPS